MTVNHILKEKGTEIVSAQPDMPLLDVAAMLAERRIGAVLIVEVNGKVAGIISERDVVRAVAERSGDLTGARVADFMTRDLITCTPDDTLDQLMSLMTEGRVRHLPVMDNGKLCGLISIGDVVKHRIAEVEFEAEEMKRYISG